MKGRGQRGIQHVFVFLSRGCFDGEFVYRPYCGMYIVYMKWRVAGK
jgi:hypothetical protein